MFAWKLATGASAPIHRFTGLDEVAGAFVIGSSTAFAFPEHDRLVMAMAKRHEFTFDDQASTIGYRCAIGGCGFYERQVYFNHLVISPRALVTSRQEL